MFDPMSHSFIQNCCFWIILQVSQSLSKTKDLCQKEGKTNFSRLLQTVRNRDCSVFGNHWRRM